MPEGFRTKFSRGAVSNSGPTTARPPQRPQHRVLPPRLEKTAALARTLNLLDLL